jgi:hypothetical protein
MADIDVKFDPISVTTGPTTVTVAGLNDIKIAFTEPIETKSSLTLSVPDTIKTDATAKLTTDSKIATDSKVATDSKLALVLPDPIRTESKAALDLQPVVLDQCLSSALERCRSPTCACPIASGSASRCSGWRFSA